MPTFAVTAGQDFDNLKTISLKNRRYRDTVTGMPVIGVLQMAVTRVPPVGFQIPNTRGLPFT